MITCNNDFQFESDGGEKVHTVEERIIAL
jgi:hypothetical protein